MELGQIVAPHDGGQRIGITGKSRDVFGVLSKGVAKAAASLKPWTILA
jgi:hypothetical protein